MESLVFTTTEIICYREPDLVLTGCHYLANQRLVEFEGDHAMAALSLACGLTDLHDCLRVRPIVPLPGEVAIEVTSRNYQGTLEDSRLRLSAAVIHAALTILQTVDGIDVTAQEPGAPSGYFRMAAKLLGMRDDQIHRTLEAVAGLEA